MIFKKILASTLIFSSCWASAAEPRLKLWVTDSVGIRPGESCYLDEATLRTHTLPATRPTLTEEDVTAWDPVRARWTLDQARHPVSRRGQDLLDHCFFMSIDGQPIAAGIALSEHSARLTGYTTLTVLLRGDTVVLEMLTSNHGMSIRHAHYDSIHSVLGATKASGP